MKSGLNLKQKLVVILMDLLLLTELAYSIFLGHRYGDAMTGVFLRTFIPAAVLTVVGARVLIRRLSRQESLSSIENA